MTRMVLRLITFRLIFVSYFFEYYVLLIIEHRRYVHVLRFGETEIRIVLSDLLQAVESEKKEEYTHECRKALRATNSVNCSRMWNTVTNARLSNPDPCSGGTRDRGRRCIRSSLYSLGRHLKRTKCVQLNSCGLG